MRVPHQRHRLAALAVAGLVLPVALSACSDSSDSGADGATKIGLISAEQGPFAFAGTSYLKGAELAAKQLAEDGVDIELVVEEGSEDPAKSITAFNKLVGQEDVSEVICCISSAVAGAMKPLAVQREVPLVVYGATTPGLEDPPYVFRPALLPQQGIAPVATELAEALEPANAVHVTASDNDGLVAQSEAAQDALTAAGVENLGVVNTLVADTDFSGAVTDILSKEPDMVAIYTLGEAAANIVKSLRERNYDGIILANNAIATGPNLDSFGATLADTYYSVEYFPTSEEPLAADFTAAYEEEYGETPDLFSSQGYTATMYAAAGVSGSDGEVTSQTISDALTGISTLDSVWGELTFENGQSNSSSFQVVQIDSSGTPQLWSGS